MVSKIYSNDDVHESLIVLYNLRSPLKPALEKLIKSKASLSLCLSLDIVNEDIFLIRR